MKYCLKCGEIVSDNSTSKDRTTCAECGTPYEEDDMTGERFESLSEFQKQQYADKLFAKIKSSDIFDKELFKEHIRDYGEVSLYNSWWYDKAEQLGSRRPLRYETDEQRKERLDREYGKNSPAYKQAILQNHTNISSRGQQANKNVVRCFYCHSTNVKRISTFSKILDFQLFGFFGQKRRYQWHCNNCNSDF